MQIEDYFAQLQAQINGCLVVASSTLRFDKRAPALGFVRGDLILLDGSTLHIREFVDVQYTIIRDTFAYQYMDANKQLIFRYDNTDHHRHLNLPTHPHHKHDGNDANVIASHAPTLADVLAEIELLVELP